MSQLYSPGPPAEESPLKLVSPGRLEPPDPAAAWQTVIWTRVKHHRNVKHPGAAGVNQLQHYSKTRESRSTVLSTVRKFMWLHTSRVQHMRRRFTHTYITTILYKGNRRKTEESSSEEEDKHIHSYPPFHSRRHTSCFRPFIRTLKYHLQSFIYNFSLWVTVQHHLVISTLVINDLLHLAALIFREVPSRWD